VTDNAAHRHAALRRDHAGAHPEGAARREGGRGHAGLRFGRVIRHEERLATPVIGQKQFFRIEPYRAFSQYEAYAETQSIDVIEKNRTLNF
jgi:hypothetical protein